MTDQHRMDVVYFGSGAFGLPTLQNLCEHHRVRGVVTQPDRPAGRGKKLSPNPIAAWAQTNLPEAQIIKHPRVSDPETAQIIRDVQADAWVVIAFGQKLSRELLADRFAINLHASLLPRWRGAAPINHAILAGDTHTGNSVITLADRMDAGFVLGQNTTEIGPTETTGGLHDRLSEMGPELVQRVLEDHASGSTNPVTQDESAVTLAGKLSRDDAVLDFTLSADQCRCRINGLSPWPGVAVMIAGARVKLLRSESQESDVTTMPANPGELMNPDAGLIQTGDGLLRLLEVQPAGKKPMTWADFARGHQPETNTRITPA